MDALKLKLHGLSRPNSYLSATIEFEITEPSKTSKT